MGKNTLNLSGGNLIDKQETVRFDLNMNPLGIPTSVTNAISNNVSQLNLYPDTSYKRLKESISEYCNISADHIAIGSCSYELLKLLIEFNSPKKALLVTPGAQHYEAILRLHGCEISYYETKEEDSFALDTDAFIPLLNDDLDMVFLSNPNCITSQLIDKAAVTSIAEACKEHGIFLVIDEKYMEFVKDYKDATAVSLADEYEHVAVLRNTSKFFAVPGLRLAYVIFSNTVLQKTLDIAHFPYPVGRLAEAAGIEMLKDASYIKNTNIMINTERNLVVSALASRKTIRLYKPAANFILIRLLKEDLTAQDVAEHCMKRELYIRNCSDITGLDNHYIRFCFMNPKQNDLLVNTILEIV